MSSELKGKTVKKISQAGWAARTLVPAAGVALALTGATAAQAAPAKPAAPVQRAADPVPAFDFKDCPTLPTKYARLGSTCFEVVVTSGQFKLGKFDQQLTSPVRMTFANALDPETDTYTAIFGKMHSEKMVVRPGIFGDPILTAVYAKPEYAGVFDQPTGLGFPIKLGLQIRLTNPFLGGACLIGSSTNPIVLNLTTGTTAPPAPTPPITGKTPTIIQRDPFVIRSATHVDNTFAVPGAKGCALNVGLVNHIVNGQAGVPAAAGQSQMVFNEYIGQMPYTRLP